MSTHIQRICQTSVEDARSSIQHTNSIEQLRECLEHEMGAGNRSSLIRAIRARMRLLGVETTTNLVGNAKAMEVGMAAKGKAKAAGFEVVGHAQVEVDKLSMHPDAVMPIGADDAQALSTSIAETGHINQDLLVLADTLEVIDGCNRLAAARQIGLEKVWCKLVRADDPRKIVLDSLSVGRSRTCGQRIMAFIELNQDAVLDAYQAALAEQRGVLKKGCAPVKSRDFTGNNPFHPQHIAARLCVSEKDVLIGIKLYIETLDSIDPERNERAKAVMGRVYAGATPIRRSLAALAGKAAEQNGRASTNYDNVAAEGMNKLKNLFQHWDAFTVEEKRRYEDWFAADVAPHMPLALVEHLIPAEMRRVR